MCDDHIIFDINPDLNNGSIKPNQVFRAMVSEPEKGVYQAGMRFLVFDNSGVANERKENVEVNSGDFMLEVPILTAYNGSVFVLDPFPEGMVLTEVRERDLDRYACEELVNSAEMIGTFFIAQKFDPSEIFEVDTEYLGIERCSPTYNDFSINGKADRMIAGINYSVTLKDPIKSDYGMQ